MHASKQHAAPQTASRTQLLPTPHPCSSANSFRKIRFQRIENRPPRRHVQFRSPFRPYLIAAQQKTEWQLRFNAKDINHDLNGIFHLHMQTPASIPP
ncbi:MAG: hypothetical protein PHI64_13550 [Zoogloea sp.]|uniref:hypothetical protein n=1 Tax=Zoogloea sp. TaxID=49181 RepID=UPI00261CD356|nr:hypothetical protein [Zoogloea sp.]MDD2989976.1 hypothetical protein [Zoogloea sp.]